MEMKKDLIQQKILLENFFLENQKEILNENKNIKNNNHQL